MRKGVEAGPAVPHPRCPSGRSFVSPFLRLAAASKWPRAIGAVVAGDRGCLLVAGRTSLKVGLSWNRWRVACASTIAGLALAHDAASVESLLPSSAGSRKSASAAMTGITSQSDGCYKRPLIFKFPESPRSREPMRSTGYVRQGAWMEMGALYCEYLMVVVRFLFWTTSCTGSELAPT
jgi:hypothetical protein